VGLALGARGQVNSWTNPVSGYWQDPFWSLGESPGPGQTILFTNAGWKALAIGSTTPTNELSVNSLTVSSPPNTFNELLFNFSGPTRPLVIGDANFQGSLLVASNSAVVMLYGGLQVLDNIIMNQEQGAFSIGGTFTEDEFSQVSAIFMHVGDIGPAVFNLTNSLLSITTESIGGAFGATFNHGSGTNSFSLMVLRNAQYDLFDGEVSGTISVGATLHHFGGTINGEMDFGFGTYILDGGIHTGDTVAPTGNEAALIQQSGGTNCGALTLGRAISLAAIGFGTYSLSNGVLATPGTTINGAGDFEQWGGFHFVNGPLSLSGALIAGGTFVPANYSLHNGFLSANSLAIDIGTFSQSGGTNQINGLVDLSGFPPGPGIYNLSGGLLSDVNADVSFSPGGGFFQSGGTHLVGNTLTVEAFNFPFSGYVLSGGTLVAPNIQVLSGATFHHTGGTITNQYLLTLAAGNWETRAGQQQLGALLLGVSMGSASTLTFPSSPAVLRFGNSSGVTWSNQATLTIERWNGSPAGGGADQLFFGSDATGLTAQELSQIRFHNPDGFAGYFPARILATGEVVPARLLAERRNGNQLILTWGSGFALQSATVVTGPYTDVTGATSPFTVNLTGPARFFRLRANP
jgi:hypothetical protein